MNRRVVLYSGQVQGVGFRATVSGLAHGTSVVGYVRNLPDGRVELVAEGDEADLDSFLGRIGQRMGAYLTGVHDSVQPATGEFKRFEIRL